tara:strand:- start:370 stop:510 length:141 start_codon:yes stop_codon:yes gene_type:complete
MVLAYKFKGQRFECGSVEGFIEATNFVYDTEFAPKEAALDTLVAAG